MSDKKLSLEQLDHLIKMISRNPQTKIHRIYPIIDTNGQIGFIGFSVGKKGMKVFDIEDRMSNEPLYDQIYAWLDVRFTDVTE